MEGGFIFPPPKKPPNREEDLQKVGKNLVGQNFVIIRLATYLKFLG